MISIKDFMRIFCDARYLDLWRVNHKPIAELNEIEYLKLVDKVPNLGGVK